MAEIIDFESFRPPPHPGNGAREALLAILQHEQATDRLLGDLWLAGFKIVPLEPTDFEAEGRR